jgi:intein/homing endonuclease
MFRQVVRIMNVDGVRWIETIPDTMYRSPNSHMILCRSRGKGSRGSIKGSRFFAFTITPNGKYRKMRGSKGSIRYFTTPTQAASEAAKHLVRTQKEWLATKLVNEIEELTLKARDLRNEVAHLEEARSRVKDTERRPSTQAEVGKPNRATALSRRSHTAGLPGFLARSAEIVMRSVLH